MINKALLMLGSESLDPVLSIYISPDISNLPSVSGKLSTGKAFYTKKPGETTVKFSELDLNEILTIRYSEEIQLYTSNLMPATEPYSGGVERAPSILLVDLRIGDRTQPASISLT